MEFSQSMKQTITNFVNSIGNTINTKISLHNNSSNAHQDIRNSIPVASSIVPNADTSDGSIGNSVTWAKADHTHPKSSLYAESTHVHNNYMENNHGHSNYVNISDVSSLYLSDEDMPNGIRKDCNHTVNYDKSTGFTQIRVNEGNTSNTGHGYYLTIPFSAPSNNFGISVDFYTTGMGNDDFGIRVCDKKALDNGEGFKSYGSWIITGQSRLAYGYGGFAGNSTLYGDRLGTIGNNAQYRYTFRLTDSQAYYCLKNLNNDTIVSEKTYTRTDSYSFSGSYYFYIGTGKFSYGSADKSIYFKNLTIQENCMNPYPIGAIYMSVDSTNPSTLFGGIWEQIKDRFILGVGDTYSNGATGGEANHTLTVSEMPSHNHSTTLYGHNNKGNISSNHRSVWSGSTDMSASNWIQNTGGNQAHNNMPPYLAVYIWKRIA